MEKLSGIVKAHTSGIDSCGRLGEERPKVLLFEVPNGIVEGRSGCIGVGV